MKKVYLALALAPLAACSHAPAKLELVNKQVNKEIVYTADKEQYGVRDLAIAYAPSNQGDCEDYALQKMFELEKQGQPLQSMAIEVCLDSSPAHAYLSVQSGQETYYLDNMTNVIWSVSPCKTNPIRYSAENIKRFTKNTNQGIVWNRTWQTALLKMKPNRK